MIHTRQQLIDWVVAHVADRVLRNAVAGGQVELLGGFNPLPTSTNAGWIVRATSLSKHEYLIAVAVDPDTDAPYWFQARRIEWDKWIGHTSENPLYQGDNPRLYEELKLNWQGIDFRYNRIARCSGLHPEEDGGDGDAERTGGMASHDV